MNCNNAESYFMKYMDNVLNEYEALELNTHIKECEKCREEFLIYNMMLEEFSAEELFETPDGFEIKIMEQVRQLPKFQIQPESKSDSIICIVWGVISGLLGFGFLLTLYKQELIVFLSSYASLESLVNILKPISDFASSFMLSFVNNIVGLVTSGTMFLTNTRFYVLLIIVLLSLVRLVYTRFSKVSDK